LLSGGQATLNSQLTHIPVPALKTVLNQITPQKLNQVSPEQAHHLSREVMHFLNGERFLEETAAVGGVAPDGFSRAPTAFRLAGAGSSGLGGRHYLPPNSGRSPGSTLKTGFLADAVRYSWLYVFNMWWYTVPHMKQVWSSYRSERNLALSKGLALPVSNPKSFFSAMRVMGISGRFYPLGYVALEDGEVLREAREAFDKYFDSPELPSDAVRAFNAFLERAKDYNPGRRVPNLMKRVRDSMLKASLQPVEQLPAFFDGLLLPEQQQQARQFQKNGRPAEVSRAFEAAVVETLKEEDATSSGRVLGVVVLGSYVNGSATPTSDIDIEVITADGRFRSARSFIQRLENRWNSGSYSFASMNAHSYAVAPSRRLFSWVHNETYKIVSGDQALVEGLKRVQGEAAAVQFNRKLTWIGRLHRWTHRWEVQSVIAVYNFFLGLSDIVRGKGGGNPVVPPSTSEAVPPYPMKPVTGLMIYRIVSIIAYIFTGLVAYPLLAQSIVGPAGFASLMAFGALAGIAIAPFNGYLVNRLSLRNVMVLNTVFRTAMTVSTPIFLSLGWYNFPVMLVLSIFNSWNFSSIMITEGAVISRLLGGKTKEHAKRITTINALGILSHYVLMVGMGLLLNAGRLVDVWGYSKVFWVAGALQLALIFLIVLPMIPNIRIEKDRFKKIGKPFPNLKSHLPYAALVLLTMAFYIFGSKIALLAPMFGIPILGPILKGTTPVVLSLLPWIMKSKGFKIVRKDKILFAVLLVLTLSSFLFYPIQSYLIPVLSNLGLFGAKGVVQSMLLGALFSGQLLASSALVKIPEKWRKWLKIGLVALTIATFYFKLAPGNLWVTVLGGVASSLLVQVAPKIQNRTWVKFYGLGLAFMWLPYLFWPNLHVLFLSLMMLGLFFGPVQITLISMYQNRAKQVEEDNPKSGAVGLAMAINSAFLGAASSFGYALLGTMANPVTGLGFPSTFLFIGAVFTAVGILFFMIPRWIPNFKKSFWRRGQEKQASSGGTEDSKLARSFSEDSLGPLALA
ncbi:MAG: nucleotidyltransferase domain-containing protein, partial [Elusimicrobia bacterium]|nr:nucleotidyltransferase domain-containing protein [Elusimicrobiota bacterium]